MDRVDEEIEAKHEARAEIAARARPLANVLGSTAQWAYQASLRDTDTDDADSAILVAAEAHTGKLGEWGGVVKEVFGSIYDPTGMNPVPPGTRHALADGINGALEAMPAWPEIQAAGSVTRDIAATSTAEVADALAEALGITKLSEDDKGEDPEDLEAQLDALQEFRDQLSGEAKAAADKTARDLEARIKKNRARREALQKRLQDLQGKPGGLGKILAPIAEAAKGRADTARSLRGCGLAADPVTGHDPVKVELLDKLRGGTNLQHIIDLMGRMQRASRANAPHAVSEGRLIPVDLRKTRDLTDLLAVEWALERENPDQFTRRWMDGDTLGVARQATSPRHRGDCLVLVDRSGSMHGERIQWARALAGAVAIEATRDHRRVGLMMFSGTGDHLALTVRGTADLGAALHLLGTSASGGTDTADALGESLRMLPDLREPDVLLITDGEWPDLPDDLIASLEKTKARLFVILLEGSATVKGAAQVWSIPTLTVDTAVEVIHSVAGFRG